MAHGQPVPYLSRSLDATNEKAQKSTALETVRDRPLPRFILRRKPIRRGMPAPAQIDNRAPQALSQSARFLTPMPTRYNASATGGHCILDQIVLVPRRVAPLRRFAYRSTRGVSSGARGEWSDTQALLGCSKGR
jgi:hypothetical protein